MNDNIFKHNYDITQNERCQLNQHDAFVIWLTGLPCSGKSTLANGLDKMFYERGIRSYVLDGENLRRGLNADLSFSKEDRQENLRRIAHLTQLFMDAGIICIAAVVAPIKKDRLKLKELIGNQNFVEIHVNTPLEICKKRDTKGLYKKARKGEIKDFTGINSPYEQPENPDIIIDTSRERIDESIIRIINYINRRFNLKH